MSNPPVDVQKHGQSIWMDNIRRSLIEDGTFQRWINESGVVGVTSNPSIFQKAIGDSNDYDSEMLNLLELEPEAVYEKLAIRDIQDATDLFLPIYQSTNGKDGYVSLEVSPHLAHKTEETIAEAKRLHAEVNRPNVMIKIPATPEGIPAIEEAIAAGINVNVTLIFAVDSYVKVAEAYIKGLQRRMDAGEDVSKIASVASFFVSRIDGMVDKMLENNIRAAQVQGDTGRMKANEQLLGKAAIANAKLAYKHFLEIFQSDQFAKLQQAGASVQRPLWASTSTKNPAYSDTLYVDSLIGQDTVNTVPPKTLVAFQDHGEVRGETILEEIDQAEDILDMLAEVGIKIEDVTNRLLEDGVEAFADAFDELIGQVAAKRTLLQTDVMGKQKNALGIYKDRVEQAVTTLAGQYFNSRIWNHDGSIWKDNGPTIAKIENRLGWLDVLETIDIERLKTLQASIKEFKHVVLLGMGGSSLAPEVLFETFGQQDGFPNLLVLDSTHPQQIKNIEDAVDISKTLFIVASKSGGTIETLSFYKYFYQQTGENGSQFIAITDPDSQLQKLAEEKQFRDIFLNPADIGGRYSALSYFGMVPAALIGLDLDRMWQNATAMINACGSIIPEDNHPGISLGAIMGAIGKEGRDKIAIYTSQSIVSFGNWVEQLIAESVGKEGVGLLPVVGATVARPQDYATDRLFIYLKVEGDKGNDELDAGIKTLREAGHPRVTLLLDDPYAIAGEFFRWEYATAVAGKLLDINPFDEPNVTEAKQITGRLLDHYEENKSLPQSEPVISGENVELYSNEHTLAPLRELCLAHGYDANSRTEMLAAQIIGTHSGDYFSILAYLPTTSEITGKIDAIRERLRHVTRRAVTVGYGPRYLHSTGQLHKGGPNNGVFLLITAEQTSDIAIPDEQYSFAVLNDAQALGDMETLQNHNRRVLRLHIKGDVGAGLDKLMAAVAFVEERRK